MNRFLKFFLLVIFSATFILGPTSEGKCLEDLSGKPDQHISGSMDYSKAVGQLLQYSPFLTNTSLEVRVRSLDESDSRYAFIPGVTFRTRFYPHQPTESDSNDPYSLEFAVDSYNPIEVYVTLQARKIITRIAVLAHLQAISDALQRLGIGYLELEKMENLETLQKEWIELAKESILFHRNRIATGGSSSLDLQLAEQELEVGNAELEKMAVARATVLDGVKHLIGLQPGQMPDLSLQNVHEQVIDGFDPDRASLDEAKARSVDLKIQHLKVDLQKRNVTVAYARFMPNLLFGLTTTDPLSAQHDRGLFFSVGFELPLWDGLKRFHNISRQKTILQQYNTENSLKETDLESKWKAAQEKLRSAKVQLKLARSQEKLVSLRERQVRIGYNAGREDLATVLAEQRKHIEARKSILTNQLEYEKSVLALRNLSGHLLNSYVSPGSDEKANDDSIPPGQGNPEENSAL